MNNGTTLKLKALGLKVTPQRQAILKLLKGYRTHPSADQVYQEISKGYPGISFATVYNTLRAFCEAGLMNEVVVDGSKSYFDTRMDDHPHFYWEDSATLTDAPAEDLRIEGLPAAPEGMQVARVDVVIRLKRA